MSVNLPQVLSLSEFYKLRDSTSDRLEYIDGMVYMTPSPSTQHQRISGKMFVKLFQFLEGKECEVFPAPFDIELCRSDQPDESKVVIPDLSVICDKSKLKEDKYKGAPDLIVEIISPSNQSQDLVIKLNLYMRYGVKEYWIVNPLLNTVQIYVLNEEGQYRQTEVLKDKEVAHSEVLEGFSLRIEDLFGDS